MDQDSQTATFEVPADTVVKIGGLPFRLAASASIMGHVGSYQLALSQAVTSGAMPDQATCPTVASSTSSLDE